jgi:phosphate transport system protein
MGTSFQDQLDSLVGKLVMMASAITSSIRWASDALLCRDLGLASQVLETVAETKQQRFEVEEAVYHLLARHQPVAGDLRLAVAGLHVAVDLQRMGELAEHICKIMLLHHPEVAVPHEIAPQVRKMADVAERLAWKVTRVLEIRDADLASQLERDDDTMDSLQRELLEMFVHHWPHGVRSAVDTVLLARFYERYADHAVNAGRQVVYLVTGSHRNLRPMG